MQLMGLGGWEWILLVFVVLMLFGSRKIPDLARSLGRAMGEFRRGREELERELRAGASPETEIVRTARGLGIPTEGKSEDDLRREITARVQKA